MTGIFQMRCPVCKSKLNAKVSLIGQTRPCPKCQSPVLIQQETEKPAELLSIRPPQLEYQNRYFILGQDRVIAAWDVSKGWTVNVGSGFAPVRTNAAAIPDQGEFVFIEMVMESGVPKKLNFSKISGRGALTVLYRDANAVLGKLEGETDLSDTQKETFIRHLYSTFMHSVLEQAPEIMQSLSKNAEN
ncbi:MAG: hypothetical protein LBH00_03700 [Planctomycetaceae bacterium]|jgi:hypothetical protein|nr:hypothetical protein [Planctomycetaceae bacterium]